MRSEAIKPGDVIAGKYRVRTILGRSRGFLVEAFHTEFDQRVVARVLSPALCDDKEIERFRREARTLAKLESEYVARIIDVGTLSDGAFYLVRQYLEGQDLEAYLKKSGPLPIPQAVLFILQVAEVLAQTHAHNIILRELQPDHLFLAQRMGGAPVLKVVDFGTAKLMRDVAAPGAGGEMTATTMIGLSPYSSPEVIRKAKNVDIRTDIWSLGTILYQMLAGRPPFGGDMATLMLQISREDPPTLSSLRRDVTADLDNIIGWTLAKDVDGRFTNIHAFAHALTPFAPPEGQVLIQRIGEIAAAAKQRKRAVALAPGSPGGDADVDDEAPTYVEAGDDESSGANPGAAAVRAPGNGESPLDRTMFMGADYVAPSPGPPGSSSPPPRPGPPGPAAGASPMFGGAAAVTTPLPRGLGAQPASILGPSRNFEGGGRAAVPSWPGSPASPGSPGSPGGPGVSASQPAGASRPSGATPPSSVEPAARASVPPRAESVLARNKRNLVLAAAAGGCIGLSLIIVLVVFFTRRSPETSTAAAAATETGISVPPPTEPTPSPTPSPTPAEPAPTGEPVAKSEPVATAAPTGTTPPPTVVAGGTPPGPTAPSGASTRPGGTGAQTGAATAKPTPTAAPVPTPTPAATPAAAGGGTGTLVAVAVGGSCAFSVNGASKGSGATIKVQLPAGTYSVSCKPATGATKSRSVTVTGGGTAMAMFKLQ